MNRWIVFASRRRHTSCAVVTGVQTCALPILTGDAQGKLMFEQQPGKMASAEALCEGEEAANFSILTIGDLSNSCEGVRHILERSAERRVGKECDRTSRSRWSPYQ